MTCSTHADIDISRFPIRRAPSTPTTKGAQEDDRRLPLFRSSHMCPISASLLPTTALDIVRPLGRWYLTVSTACHNFTRNHQPSPSQSCLYT